MRHGGTFHAVAISRAQWAAVADDLNLTVRELQERIAQIDERDPGRWSPPLFFDRDLEPLTLGQFGMLFDSRSYRLLAQSTLPSGQWVATIWRGLNEEGAEPPVVFETSVFPAPPKSGQLGLALYREEHGSEVEAMTRHDSIVEEWTEAEAKRSNGKR
jgi:hypothetical protein